MPETIKQELIRRLELNKFLDSELNWRVPMQRDRLPAPIMASLFTRMALTILRADSEPEGETLP